METYLEIVTLNVNDVVTTSTVVCDGKTECDGFDPFA